MEVAQKAKIKWAIEGDENSKYYHGILNKKEASLLAVPWVSRLQLDIDFSNKLKLDQQVKLENNFTREETKRAVWDCEADKSPCLDGFIFGFYHWWCGLIQSCLRSYRGSVIMNGSPTREFQFHRGLKHGDPLSPFLFISIMECLHILVQRVVDACMFRGISMGPSLHLSHLFYADDVVFMGHWSNSNIDTIFLAAAKIGCATLEAPFSYLRTKINSFKVGLRFDAHLLYVVVKVLMKVLQRMASIRYYFFNGIDHIGNPGEDGKLGKKVNHNHASIWLDIVREMEQLKNYAKDLIGFTRRWNGTVVVKMSHENVGYSLRRIPRGEGSGEFSVAFIRRLIDER
nr:RNA-directed DNA polymerase, eukaryota [Tanacetum cinerariifolium]